jgi:hypothetical protein
MQISRLFRVYHQLVHPTYLPPNICAIVAPVCKVFPYGMQRCTPVTVASPHILPPQKKLSPANKPQKQHEHTDWYVRSTPAKMCAIVASVTKVLLWGMGGENTKTSLTLHTIPSIFHTRWNNVPSIQPTSWCPCLCTMNTTVTVHIVQRPHPPTAGKVKKKKERAGSFLSCFFFFFFDTFQSFRFIVEYNYCG